MGYHYVAQDYLELGRQRNSRRKMSEKTTSLQEISVSTQKSWKLRSTVRVYAK